MTQADQVYILNIGPGESIQLWIHGYDRETFVGFDLKPGFYASGDGVEFLGKLFLAYSVVGVGEHADTTLGYTLLFTNQSDSVLIPDGVVTAVLVNLYEPITNPTF